MQEIANWALETAQVHGATFTGGVVKVSAFSGIR